MVNSNEKISVRAVYGGEDNTGHGSTTGHKQSSSAFSSGTEEEEKTTSRS